MSIKESITNKVFNTVINSLEYIEPFNLDFFDDEGRYIVEFSGRNADIKLQKAEILDSEWKLLPDASERFQQRLEKYLVFRNKRVKEAIEQAEEIYSDRCGY